MVDIHHTSTANAPVSLMFEYMDDYRMVPKWMFGLSRMEPLSEQTSGVGAVYDGSMKLGPKTLHSTVEVTRWERDEAIAMSSVKGFVNRSTWVFEAVDDEHTRLRVDFVYELPCGLAGRALGKVIEPFVAVAIRHTESQLREQVERLHAERGER
ncbi:MAG: SRPBCC family protein [Thermocrispum sp.]